MKIIPLKKEDVYKCLGYNKMFATHDTTNEVIDWINSAGTETQYGLTAAIMYGIR